AVVVTLVGVIQDATGFQRAAQTTGEENGNFGRVVLAAGPHAVDEHETGMVEHGAFALPHRLETAREVSELAAIVTGNPLVGIGLIVVRGRMVRGANVQE